VLEAQQSNFLILPVVTRGNWLFVHNSRVVVMVHLAVFEFFTVYYAVCWKRFLNDITVSLQNFCVVAGAKICYDTVLSDLSIHANRFVVTSLDLQTDQFDCVVLTMPVPQLLQLRGDIVHLLGAFLYILISRRHIVSGDFCYIFLEDKIVCYFF